MKASFDLLDVTHRENAKHTRRTGSSVLRVGKEQKEVVIPCPVRYIGFKDAVVEYPHIIARNGSHFQIIALGDEMRIRKRKYRSQKGKEKKGEDRKKRHKE